MPTPFRLLTHGRKPPGSAFWFINADSLLRNVAATGGDTFATISTRYLEEYAKKKNKSWKQGSTLITRYALPHWAERDASTITRADVRALLAKIEAPIMQNQILASCSAVFTWAGRQQLLANNPCRGIERHDATSRERVLSDAEVPLFWQAFGGLDCQAWHSKCYFYRTTSW